MSDHAVIILSITGVLLIGLFIIRLVIANSNAIRMFTMILRENEKYTIFSSHNTETFIFENGEVFHYRMDDYGRSISSCTRGSDTSIFIYKRMRKYV